jgi:hypothetical protein
MSTPAHQPSRPVAILGGNFCALTLLTGLARSEALHTGDPHEVMAGYLRALPAYVQWPTNTFATPEEPWHIGILGLDPFGGMLETILHDRQAAGRGFEIWHATKLKDLPPCEIIFIAGKDAEEIKIILKQLGSRPVLTVSDHDNFLVLGGIIQLQARATVRMAINLDRARAAQLTIPGKMLEVASEVIENGERRILKN